MQTIDWTNIILGLMTLAGGCGWLVDRRKYKAEVKAMEADSKQKYMDLAKEYVEEFRKNIVEPLKEQVDELKMEVRRLKNAIEAINSCNYRDECPVRKRMQDDARSNGD